MIRDMTFDLTRDRGIERLPDEWVGKEADSEAQKRYIGIFCTKTLV